MPRRCFSLCFFPFQEILSYLHRTMRNKFCVKKTKSFWWAEMLRPDLFKFQNHFIFNPLCLTRIISFYFPKTYSQFTYPSYTSIQICRHTPLPQIKSHLGSPLGHMTSLLQYGWNNRNLQYEVLLILANPFSFATSYSF